MTTQALIAIAALCSLPAVGPLFPVKHEQLKCQKAFVKCVRKFSTGNPKKDRTREGEVIEACLMERDS